MEKFKTGMNVFTPKEIIDLSRSIHPNMPQHPEDNPFKIKRLKSFQTHNSTLEVLNITTHTGTHIDAPLHLIKDGRSIDKIPLELFQGEAIPIDLFSKEEDESITEKDFLKYNRFIKNGNIVLLCTGWQERAMSKKSYIYHSPYLTEDGAWYLVSKGIRGVGIDHLTIGTIDPGKDIPPNITLLKNNVWIMENMYLPKRLLKKKRWYFIGLPINIKGVSGSFVRPVVIVS